MFHTVLIAAWFRHCRLLTTRAVAMAAETESKLELVSINPSSIVGPPVLSRTDGSSSHCRRDFCHSAATTPSPFSRCFNVDGEGMSVK